MDLGSKPYPRCDVGDPGGSLMDHLLESHRDELKLGDSRQANIIVNNLKAGNLNFLSKFNCIYVYFVVYLGDT